MHGIAYSSSKPYHTNACCRPEYAMRGIINSIRTFNNGVITDFEREITDAYKLSGECTWSSSSLLSRFCKKHISMVPKVILQRNTTNSKVVPLVAPSCNDMKTKMKSLMIRSKIETNKVELTYASFGQVHIILYTLQDNTQFM